MSRTSALLSILKHEKYREMPWRNGQGSTLEIAREPSQGQEFAWRLSLAKLERASNFSAYPDYRRAIVLISGTDLRLTFWGHGVRRLDARDRCARFEGCWRTRGMVPLGPCMDLSLIVRGQSNSGTSSIVRAPKVLRITSQRQLIVPNGLNIALMPLSGKVAIAHPVGFRARTLRPLDTLLLTPARGQILDLCGTAEAPADVVLLQWRAGRSTIGKANRGL